VKKFLKDQDADVKMIGMVVGILVTLIVAILVFYNIAGSVGSDLSDLDSDVETNRAGGNTTSGTPVTNATDAILDQSSTFFTIAPIIAIVIVAVVILGFVNKI